MTSLFHHFNSQIQKCNAHLQPLRSGSSLFSAEELAELDREWTQWRGEWVRRKKIFNEYVRPHALTSSSPGQTRNATLSLRLRPLAHPWT